MGLRRRRTTGGNIMETLFLLLLPSAVLHYAGALDFQVCPLTESSVLLKNSEDFFVHTREAFLSFNVVSKTCNINEHIYVDLDLVEKLGHLKIKDDFDREWWLMHCTLSGDTLNIQVGDFPSYNITKTVAPSRACLQDSASYNVTFVSSVKFGKKCNEEAPVFSYVAATTTPDGGVGDDNIDFDELLKILNSKNWGDYSNQNQNFDTLNSNNWGDTSDQNQNVDILNIKNWGDYSDQNQNFDIPTIMPDLRDILKNSERVKNLNIPTLEDYNTPPPYTHYTSSYHGGHVIFIPVGAFLFLLSVCLRYCCCVRRVKKVTTSNQQRVGSITIIRRVPLPPPNSSSSSPGGFVNVTEPTPPHPMDQPPAYADIEPELPPPAYSELEVVNNKEPTEIQDEGEISPPPVESNDLNASGPEAPSFSSVNISDALGGEGGGGPSTAVVDMTATKTENKDVSQGETGSALSRFLTAGSRSIRSPFSYKSMEEEE